MRIVVIFATLALSILPLSAGVKVDYEVGVDFQSYRTYAWKPGTDAIQPQVQQWIYSAVERELAAAGLRKVSIQEADLYVITHAYSKVGAHAGGGYVYVHQYAVGVITSDVVVDTTGYLLVDLIDSQSEKGVWRALASEVMGVPNPNKLRKKVDKVTRKMFKSFPPD